MRPSAIGKACPLLERFNDGTSDADIHELRLSQDVVQTAMKHFLADQVVNPAHDARRRLGDHALDDRQTLKVGLNAGHAPAR